MSSRLAKVFVQVAVVVFFLNTVSAYGACCLTLPESEASDLPPCHQVQADENLDEPAECCLACVPALQVASTIDMITVAERAELSVGNTPSITTETDPPYRPPIQRLS